MATSRTRAALALSAAVVLITGLAAAYATSQSTNGTITACVRIKTGAMRLEKPRQPCKTKAPRKYRERRVSWNQQGPPGVTGSPGADGAPGANGSPGAPGVDGASFLSGSGAPASGLGQDGDTYVNLITGDVYTRTAGAWSQAGSLLGPTGPDGDDGLAGASFLSGTDVPDSGVGHDDDSYLDLTNGDVYTKSAGGWSQSGSLLGPTGPDGPAGASFLSGTELPDSGLGQDGDTYLNLANGDVYTKSGGVWAKGGSLLGPTGKNGTGTIFTASSDSAVSVTTIAGGLAGTGAMFPLSGSSAASGVNVAGGTVDTTAVGVAQVLPADVTVTSIAASFSTTQALSLAGTTVTLKAQLYTGTGNVLSPVAGATCSLSPALSVVAVGAVSSCRTGGLNIPVAAGQKAVVMLTATAAGLSLIDTATGFASTAVGTS